MSGQQSGRASFHHAPAAARQNFREPPKKVKGTNEGYVTYDKNQMTALERRRSNEKAEKELRAAAKCERILKTVFFILFALLAAAGIVVILLWVFTCYLGGCEDLSCQECKYTKWKSYASNSARDYQGSSEESDCGDDIWAYYRQNGDSTEFTANETPNYSGDTNSDPNTSPLIAGGANKLPIYWYMDQTETRKEDGFKLVFSHSATYFSGVGNFTTQMFREIPTQEESYMVSGTDPDDPFYFPHLLLMNDKSSVCVIAYDYGYPMRWKLNNNIMEIEVYNLESEFKLYFETGDTPLEATTACISRWRDIYTNRQTNNVVWSDDFIAGTFNTSRIEELMSRAGVLPNMFILGPHEMSLSSNGETLLINNETSLTRWNTTLLGWNSRFKFLSGVDDDINESKGFYVADNETEFFYSYNRTSWQPAQNRDGFGAAGYFLFDGFMMNNSLTANSSCEAYPACYEAVSSHSTVCLDQDYGYLDNNWFSGYDRQRAKKLNSSLTFEGTATPASERIFLDLPGGRKECFYALLNLHMMGVTGASCNLCNGTAPSASQGDLADNCAFYSNLAAIISPFFVMVNDDDYAVVTNDTDAYRYIKNSLEDRDKMTYILEDAYNDAIENNKPFIYPVAAIDMSLAGNSAEGSIMIGDNVFFAAGAMISESTEGTIPAGHWISNGGYDTGYYKTGNSTWDIGSTTLNALFFYRHDNIYLIKNTTADVDSVIIRVVLNYNLYSVQPITRSFTLKGATVTVQVKPIDEEITISSSGSNTGQLQFTKIEVYFWPSCPGPDPVKSGQCKNLEGSRQVLEVNVVKSMFDSYSWPADAS